MDSIEDCVVALTTTKSLQLISEKVLPDIYRLCSSKEHQMFIRLNYPVCTVKFKYPFGIPPQSDKRFMLSWEHTVRDMAKIVLIEPEKRHLFIGDNPHDLETALVEYIDVKAGEFATEFFKQWLVLRSFLFEFQMTYPFDDSVLFTMVGHWANSKWDKLEMSRISHFNIMGKGSRN